MLDWLMRHNQPGEEPVSRRDFLKMGGLLGGVATLLALAPEEIWAKSHRHHAKHVQDPHRGRHLHAKHHHQDHHHQDRKSRVRDRSLFVYNTHTGESFHDIYWSQNRYLPESIKALNHLFRDHHSGDMVKIDPHLYEILYAVRGRMDYSKPIHIISAYRSPATNAMLREQSEAVASHSLHMEGMAVDIRMPGRRITQLHKAAMHLRQGGVGYYPSDNFVHVDTGPIRYW